MPKELPNIKYEDVNKTPTIDSDSSLYNIPFATNRTTADMILTSSLFDNKDYHRIIPKCIEDYNNRKL